MADSQRLDKVFRERLDQVYKLILKLLNSRLGTHLCALVVAIATRFEKETTEYPLIIDGVDLLVRFLDTDVVPILFICDRMRGTASIYFFVGRDIDPQLKRSLLDSYWRGYIEERNQLLLKQAEVATQVSYQKRSFVTEYRDGLNHKKWETEEKLKYECEAQQRVEEVRKWLDAGANINTTIRHEDNTKYNGVNDEVSLLRLAKWYEEEKVIAFLLERGAKE